VKHAVDPVPNAQDALIRLYVDVGSTLLDCIQQNRIAEPNDRGILTRLLEVEHAVVVFGDGDFDFRLVEALHDVVVRNLRLCIGLLERGYDRALRSNHRLDVVPREEFHIVDGVEVGWIRHRDDESVARARDRNDPVALTNLRTDELQDVSIDFVFREIDRLYAILLTQEVGDLLIGDRAQSRQRVTEADVVVFLLLLRFAQLLEADSLLAY
jgi:hypothetical protein